MRSPGGSNVTTGTPNVIPRSEASEPPSEWPITQIFAFGYIIVMFLYKFCSEEKPLSAMMNMYSMYKRTHNASGIEQALFNQSSLDTFLITLALSTIAVAHGSPHPANASAATAKQKVVV
jgi:hypothetical protein